MVRTLSFRISSLIASLLLITALAVMMSVWVSTYRFAQAQISRDLSVGSNIFQQVMGNRNQQLTNSAEVLAADFGFRQAVATHDVDTIISAMDNHSSRISADMMAILDLNGIPEVTSHINTSALASLNKGLNFKSIVARGGASLVMPLNGKAFQIVMVVIKAPAPIGIAVIGFEIDTRLALQLKQITGLDVTFLVDQQNFPTKLISTLSSPSPTELWSSIQPNWGVSFRDEPLLQSVSFPLYSSESGDIDVLVTDDLRRVFTQFDQLQLTIIAIASLAIVLALVTGILFSRQISRPLRQMVNITRRIATGQYKNHIQIKAQTREFNDLVDAFSGMQDELHDREEKITFQATHDLVTGVINRQTFTERVQDHMNLNETFTLIGFRVSNFRQINDMFGPTTADKSLINLCYRLQPLVPLLARHGGSSFVAFLEGIIDDGRLNKLAEMVRLASEADGLNINFEVQMGVVTYPADVENSIGLMRRLDIAMDSARYAHNCIHFYKAGQEEDYVKRLKIVEDLRSAMRDHGRGLEMHYQPKLNLQTGQLNRAEALIRWIHPEQGFIRPDLFIPLAEQSGLINALTEWIIDSVALQAALWHQMGHNIQIAINLSMQDITRADMLDIISHTLKKYKVRPEQIAFEITESELMQQPEQTIERLERFRKAGFRLSIDDFGTGYSSLSYLKSLPVTELKIDREFVMKLAEDVNDQTIVKSTIELAHRFNLEVIAEGVEDFRALKMLSHWGCEWAQGYYISRPLPADQVVEWMEVLKTQHELVSLARETAQV